MPALKLFLLGSPQVELRGQPLELKRRKLWALLAYLAASGQTHRRDTLATLLWPDSDQSEARAALARHLSELRQVIGAERVTTDRETAALTGEVWLDVTQFQQPSKTKTEKFSTVIRIINPASEMPRAR